MSVDGNDNSQDGNKKGNVFDFYGAKRRERRSGTGNGSDDPGYYAFGISITEDARGQEEWLRMHGEIEGQHSAIDMIRYADIVRVYSPVPELLCIMANSVIYTLEGRHLDAAIIHIQDRMLRAVYLFDPMRYAEPDEDTPIIFRMERQEMGSETEDDGWEEKTPGQ